MLEHEDIRVRKYGRKVQHSRNSFELHNVRKERFGHLPNWQHLSEETKQHILTLEEHKAKEHKEWEDWKAENNPKHARPDAVTLHGDKSGLQQMVMFKGKICSGLYLLRKSHNHGFTDKNGRTVSPFDDGRTAHGYVDFHAKPEPVEQNIQRGINALYHVAKYRVNVKNAMYKEEVGKIDFVWGKKGDPQKKFKGGYGIAHIIAKRAWEGRHDPQYRGQRGTDVAKKIIEVIARGKLDPKPAGHIWIEHDGYLAVLSPQMHGEKVTWLLTGFKKTTPDATGEGGVSSGATHPTPTLARREMVAGVNQNIPPSKNEFNKSLSTPSSQPSIPTLAADIQRTSNGRKQLTSSCAEVILKKGLPGTTKLLKRFGTSRTSRATVGIGFHDNLQKSESPAANIKPTSQNDTLTKSHQKTICVDFDGVIADYSKGFQGADIFGDPLPGAIKGMQSLKEKGWKVIIFTTRKATEALQEYLVENDIPFDSINSNSDQPEGSNPGKPIADVYLDDRAVRFEDWTQAESDIKEASPSLAKSILAAATDILKTGAASCRLH